MKASERVKYLPELTGLRGVAALWVALFHLQYNYHFSTDFYFAFFAKRWLQKGYLGVDIFFVLSGFVMAYTAAHWNGENPLKFWRNFLQKRFARIYPLHFLATLFVLGFYIYTNQLVPTWLKALTAHLTLIHGWSFFFHPDYNFPSWSISTEWAAYLAFPAILVVNRRVAKNIFALVCSSIAAGFLVAYVATQFKGGKFDLTWDWGWVRCFSEFWIGMSLYQIQLKWRPSEKLNSALVAVGLVCVALFLITDSPDYLILPIATLFVLSLSQASKVGRWCFANKVSHFLGDISYSIYMLHVPVGLTFLKYWAEYFGRNQSFLMGATALTSALGLLLVSSTIAYYKVEVPLRRWLSPKETQQTAVASESSERLSA